MRLTLPQDNTQGTDKQSKAKLFDINCMMKIQNTNEENPTCLYVGKHQDIFLLFHFFLSLCLKHSWNDVVIPTHKAQ